MRRSPINATWMRERKLIVGVNAFTQEEQRRIETMAMDDTAEREQLERLRRVKERRDGAEVRRCLEAVKRIAATDENLMPAFVEAAKARCTVGELMAALADVFGRYEGAARW